MADRIWRGDSVPKAQVTRVTPADVEAGDRFLLTVNGKQIEYVAEDSTVHDAVRGLVEAWNESTIPEFAEITAAPVDENEDGEYEHLILTADEPGKPFTVTAGTGNTSQTDDPSITIQETVTGVAPTNEVQRLTLDSVATGGTFTLSWDPGTGTETTAAISYAATASQVRSALEALPSIAPGDVLVSGGPFPSTPIYVQFAGAYEGTNVNLLTVDGTNLTGSGSVEVTTTQQGHGRSDEIQILDLVASIGGTWSINRATEAGGPSGAGSGVLDWNDPSSDVALQLGLMDFYGGNVAVDGFATLVDPRNGQTFGGAHLVRFTNALVETDIQPLSIYAGGLTPFAPGGQTHSLRTLSKGGQATQNTFQFVKLNASAGTYSLTVPDYGTTAALDWDAKIATIKSALEAVVGAGNITVHALTASGYAVNGDTRQFEHLGYILEFTGTLADTNIGQCSVNSGSLSYTAPPSVSVLLTGGAVVPELQQVQVNGAGGSFTLSFDGQTTASIAHGAAAATLKTELEALSNIALVTVSGTGTANDPYLVQFDDPAGDVAQLTGDGSLLTGGAGHAVTTVTASAGTDEQQTITLVNTAGGSFTVQFRGSTSAAITWDASAASLQSVLEGISTIGTGNVSVSGAAGGPWTVTFVGALGTENVELLISDDSGLTGTPGSDIQTLVITSEVTSGGPNHWDDPANWTGGAVPATGDDVYIASGTSDILFGLQQSGVTLASLTVHSRYSGRIGLPERTETGYWEYRPTYLAIGASVITIGNGEGTGSGRIKLDTGAVQTAITVLNTGGSIEPGLPALQWKGSHASNTLLVLGGDVGVAVLATETAQLDLTQRSGSVELGGGVSLGRLDKTGGELRADDAVLSGALIIRG